MKKSGQLIGVVLITALLSACGNTEETDITEIVPENQGIEVVSNSEEAEESEVGTDSEEYNTYVNYSGSWSIDGSSHEEVLQNGGAELICEIGRDFIFSGSFYTAQGMTERFASIDSIDGRIEDGKLDYRFTDDGWGGTGTLQIQFLVDTIVIDVLDYQMADGNTSGYGISGTYKLIRENTGDATIDSETSNGKNLSVDECSEIYYQTHYADLPEETIIQKINDRNTYYQASSYYSIVTDYLENVREMCDITNVMSPLYYTDMRYYSKEEFADAPAEIIHLAKNEIYARHGYIFKDNDINNYFMGCIWYEPTCDASDFRDTMFNDFEKKNLELLSELDH